MKWHGTGNGHGFDKRPPVELTPAVAVTGILVVAARSGLGLYIGLI